MGGSWGPSTELRPKTSIRLVFSFVPHSIYHPWSEPAGLTATLNVLRPLQNVWDRAPHPFSSFLLCSLAILLFLSEQCMAVCRGGPMVNPRAWGCAP